MSRPKRRSSPLWRISSRWNVSRDLDQKIARPSAKVFRSLSGGSFAEFHPGRPVPGSGVIDGQMGNSQARRWFLRDPDLIYKNPREPDKQLAGQLERIRRRRGSTKTVPINGKLAWAR
ncbi:MAG: hypothetical protein LBT86_07570 [Deltaproteobacteria bacterium]|nr:hypothetical protein [Deltaproteobacteria bacterium]